MDKAEMCRLIKCDPSFDKLEGSQDKAVTTLGLPTKGDMTLRMLSGAVR